MELYGKFLPELKCELLQIFNMKREANYLRDFQKLVNSH